MVQHSSAPQQQRGGQQLQLVTDAMIEETNEAFRQLCHSDCAAGATAKIVLPLFGQCGIMPQFTEGIAKVRAEAQHCHCQGCAAYLSVLERHRAQCVGLARS